MATATDLALMSAKELTEAYAARQLSPVEVTQASLDRIARTEPRLNAFCVIDPDAAVAWFNEQTDFSNYGRAISLTADRIFRQLRKEDEEKERARQEQL